ncbi:MAG: transcription antitermination factor NusB [Deltaproteobacteria bacterium]|nr:transcription antitermination factor NusB [Deltaproteobacteria bacterium]
MGNRRKARELVTQILFFMEYSPGDPEKSFELICENFDAPKSLQTFSGELVRGISENLSHIDSLIKEASKNWRLERMSRVDRSILRLSIYEMLYMESIPYKVSIDEAVELGKKYGTEESGAFINGVLDYIYIKYLQDKNRE